MDAPQGPDTAPHLVTPSPLHENMIGALEGALDTARAVLYTSPHPPRVAGLQISPRLAALQRDVESFFNLFGLVYDLLLKPSALCCILVTFA